MFLCRISHYDVRAERRSEHSSVFLTALCVRVMMVEFGAMLIPSRLFCNNSGEGEKKKEEGQAGGEAPFSSSNPSSPPLEYNLLSPDLQIMQRCSHFNWSGRHQREMSSSHSASAQGRFPFSQHVFPLLPYSFPTSHILSSVPPKACLRWRVETSCTKEMSHHRICCWSKHRNEKKKKNDSSRISCCRKTPCSFPEKKKITINFEMIDSMFS